MRQSAIDQKTHLRKRGSTATASEVHFSQPPPLTPLTPINLQIPPNLDFISPGLTVVPPTIMAIDSPSKNTTFLHSPRHTVFGSRFGFDGSAQYSTAWNDVAAMGANRVTVKGPLQKSF